MRIATYNVEWFDALFDRTGSLRPDGEWSKRWKVTRARQIEALGRVFEALDADAVMVIEAPDNGPDREGERKLEAFAARFGLRAREAITGFHNETKQEISLLYDPAVMEVHHDPRGDARFPRFDMGFEMDLDVDAFPELVHWSKPPLELAVRVGDQAFRMIGVHAKSKAPHGARGEDDAMRIAIANRRKQLAQCVWLRGRVSAHLARGEAVMVLGDFNDGPGLDEYERLFGRSGVEIMLGEAGEVRLHDPHARLALSRRLGARPSTSRFLMPDGRWLSALLDYIMVSPAFRACAPRWQIWHPFDHPECYGDPDLRSALLDASDHFPVTVDFDPAGLAPLAG